jgi:ATP-dependent Lon protease
MSNNSNNTDALTPAENTRYATRKRRHDQLLANQESMESTITDLRNQIDEQRQKIKKLEKRTKAYKYSSARLDDAITDIYERMDEMVDTLADSADYTESEANYDNYEESEEEPVTKRPRRSTANYAPGVYSEEDESGIVIELNANECAEMHEHINSEAETELHGTIDKTAISNIVKKVLQRAHPMAYVAAYCKESKLSKTETSALTAQSEEFLKLNKSGGDKSLTELDYFLQSPESERLDIVNSLTYIKSECSTDRPYKFRILTSGMENYAKNIAIYKANQLQESDPGTGDYYKVKNWLDTVMAIPWGEYRNLHVARPDIPGYLANARATMDRVIYGQNETKDVIIQIISKMIANPTKSGNVFAVYGPPGVGKTTIIKDGMSKALNLPFAFLSLGGATDSSFLDGHGYTYEGSTPGKIVDMLKKTKCMNPIFYFDELDKVSDTRKGEEVANLLIHLTDPSQNTLFQDKYLGNINIDISKAIFVFSFNDITKVNPILLDRMELIYVNGFTPAEKLTIAREYLLPELLGTYCLQGIDDNNPDVVFTDNNLTYIINYDGLATHEQGVRQIKRRLEKVCSQLNIVKLTSADPLSSSHKIHSVIDGISELKDCKWPLNISNQLIDKMLKNKGHMLSSRPPLGMYS